MNKNNFIQGYCRIKDNTVLKNEELLFSEDTSTLNEFLKLAYQHFKTDYSKFFKMDRLSKLGFLCADVLLNSLKENNLFQENTAIVLANKSASLDTDRKYQKSIEDADNYFPSPAVFVYTLPNICMGEISIRHKLYSENSFFIFDAFNADYLWEYTNSLLQNKKADSVLCGWVDVDEDSYEAFLYVVSANGNLNHTKEEITRLYFTNE
ncbi:3-oxoacyl-ACP synthase [Cytophaga sp. FL35]|uniref:3-oxoacyl-ACP synthase n=1 Tax=Cytophaga sp. FL35 TaxID=1904456 RepID=UPI0016534E7B|nr:3-oxoacyl-ACP synthase [Cytophaga sp. FL35]MBC6999305.1 3-oxoacyl-ACP synthase [Cytophaga sp. FL35]